MCPAALQAAEPTTTAILTVDLAAFRANYRTLRQLASGAECAAVIKANAYGIGMPHAVRALVAEGCVTFFAATFEEAKAVRSAAPEAVVYLLDGLFPGSAPALAVEEIRPVLCSLDEVREWSFFCAEKKSALGAALQVDTGMNRLGLPGNEVQTLARSLDLLKPFELSLLMSHLACADDPDDPKNAEQLNAFESVRSSMPPCPASLASSAGIFLGQSYHFDMVRAGFALYGGAALADKPTLAPVVQLHARIAQIHKATPGETVGYGATQKLSRPTTIATLPIGYADGIFRSLSAHNSDARLMGYIEGHPAPILGRVSMDLVTLDVTDIPGKLVRRGAWVEILGPNVSVDMLARQAGTIGYEVLTNLGRRFQRVFLDGARGETA